MPRPQRCRRICRKPQFACFSPEGAEDAEDIVLSLDEFEVIRLVDLEARTHEQCAAQMEISRTTVTEIYERARKKLADCLVNGRRLVISGGNYRICDGAAQRCCGKKCPRHTAQEETKGAVQMKIAVTYENGLVFQHFGHTEQFGIYEIEENKIVSKTVVGSGGSGHGALAGILKALGVETLICGGIGGGAQRALTDAGIRFYGGVKGSADDAVRDLLAGRLLYNPNVACDHHDHGEGHNCGEHSCGDHKCH